MVRHQWIVGLRNKVAALAGECDSAAAINGAKMSGYERETLKVKLLGIVDFIDNRI